METQSSIACGSMNIATSLSTRIFDRLYSALTDTYRLKMTIQRQFKLDQHPEVISPGMQDGLPYPN